MRILSITPAGTEILYELGLGDRVVGVTKYCSWPPDARLKPNLGDMMHVNIEVVAGFSPDMVLISNMNSQIGERIASMGYKVVTVYQDNFDQICDSMIRVGTECGVPEIASSRVDELRKLVDAISIDPAGGTRPRVLVTVGRDPADTVLKKIHVAGRGSFYNDLITRAGAENAYNQNVPYAQISREGLLRIDPDVVIELIGENGMDVPTGEIASQWKAVADLRAAQEGRVSVIKGDFTLRAGPRYPKILDAFIRAVQNGESEISE
ncbi:MAG: helical backbone metal receptor [Synergistaceae bacterium]|jgi:iron complex transport system substrate-binding protein|nr:helical backbone metal receptor [Synergistaceae bacterium]